MIFLSCVILLCFLGNPLAFIAIYTESSLCVSFYIFLHRFTDLFDFWVSRVAIHLSKHGSAIFITHIRIVLLYWNIPEYVFNTCVKGILVQPVKGIPHNLTTQTFAPHNGSSLTCRALLHYLLTLVKPLIKDDLLEMIIKITLKSSFICRHMDDSCKVTNRPNSRWFDCPDHLFLNLQPHTVVIYSLKNTHTKKARTYLWSDSDSEGILLA